MYYSEQIAYFTNFKLVLKYLFVYNNRIDLNF